MLRVRGVILQDLDDLRLPEMIGPADRISVVFAIADARIGPRCQQQPHDIRVAP